MNSSLGSKRLWRKNSIFNTNGFSFTDVSSSDVVLAIGQMRSDTVGLDRNPIRFIRLVLPVMLPVIKHIFNHYIMNLPFPNCWKLAKVIPTHKSKKGSGVEDYISICILSALLKDFEKFLKNQIFYFLESISPVFVLVIQTTTAMFKCLLMT